MDGSQDNTPVSRFPIDYQLFGNEPNDAIRLLTECFMLQVVALRTTYGQLREGKQRF